MSRQMHEIQYVRFYTDGSTARKTAAPRKQVAAAPAKQPTRSAKRPVVKIPVDPVALAGMLVAGVMPVLRHSVCAALLTAAARYSFPPVRPADGPGKGSREAFPSGRFP